MLMCLVAITATAQTVPFLEGKSWKIIGFANGHPYVSGIEPEYNYTLCFPEDCDTIVAGRTYYAMHKQEAGKDAVVALFREENGKVYIYDDKQGSEYLYYDFTLEEGDEFELNAPHGEGKMMCKVTSVEQVKYYDKVRKKLTFDAYNEQDKDNPAISHNVWVEGIGNTITPLENCQDANWEGAPDLFTAYTYCAKDGSFFPLRIEYPYYYGQGVESFTHRDVSEENVPDLTYKFEGDTLHVSGELYTECASAQYIWLTGNPDTKELQMSVETVGIALPCMELHSIDLKFPGFYEDGTYTIKDYTGTHSVVKGGSVSVPQTSISSSTSLLYDISGRRIHQKPIKGLYVDGGKVKVAK